MLTVPSLIGSIIPKAKYKPNIVLPLNLYSESAQAAIAPKSSTKNKVVTEGKVFGGSQPSVKLTVLEDAYISIPRRQIKNIKHKYVIDKNLTAPIEKGEVVGYAVIQLEGKSLTTIKLHSTEDISEGSFYRKTLDSILRSF